MHDPRDYRRYLRERERYPLFADDPSVVPPPRSLAEAEARRAQFRRDADALMDRMRRERMLRYRYLYRLALDHCSLDEIRAAQDTARRWRLPAIYWCDALSRLLARRGVV